MRVDRRSFGQCIDRFRIAAGGSVSLHAIVPNGHWVGSGGRDGISLTLSWQRAEHGGPDDEGAGPGQCAHSRRRCVRLGNAVSRLWINHRTASDELLDDRSRSRPDHNNPSLPVVLNLVRVGRYVHGSEVRSISASRMRQTSPGLMPVSCCRSIMLRR